MARYSQKQLVERSYRKTILLLVTLGLNRPGNTLHDTYLTAYGILRARRYLTRPSIYRMPRPHHPWRRLQELWRARDEDFKRNFRLTRVEFAYLFRLIQDDEVFESAGPAKQFPVRYQLMVALWRLAHNGNSASAAQIADKFHISGKS